MKKITKIILIFFICFMFSPVVFAEDLPREGVGYFMMYPNGEEVGTFDYDEATSNDEALIYSGVTNENGEIPLCGWSNEGTIRVVQHVPDGYTTNTRELVVDLSKSGDVSFINYKGLVNPSTGNTILVILVIAGVIGVTIASRKNKKSMVIVPLLAIALAAYIVNAEPDNECFCMKVKDGSGKAMTGVQVDVYATPVTVDAAPAMMYDANGGHFFDGSTEMYYRLPSETCSFQEFIDSLSEEEYFHLSDNLYDSYRDGYYRDIIEEPETFENGTVVSLTWNKNESAHVVRINGNGGTYDFYGRKMTEIYFYDDNGITFNQYVAGFYRPKSYNLGFDLLSSCPLFENYGLGFGYVPEIDSGVAEPIPGGSDAKKRVIDSDDVYVCYSEKPDGIYVNDNSFFRGTDSTCFEESDLQFVPTNVATLAGVLNPSKYMELSSFTRSYAPNYEFSVDEEGEFILTSAYVTCISFNPSNTSCVFPASYSELNGMASDQAGSVISMQVIYAYDNLDSFVIIKNGQPVISLTANDFTVEEIGDTALVRNKHIYHFKDATKRSTVQNYLVGMSDSCK